MGILHKLMPTRADAKPVKLIADLDALISQPIAVRFLGKDFVIEPMSTENFILVIKALHDMDLAVKRKEQNEHYSQDEVYAAYYNFIHSVCPTITLAEIKRAKIAQLHGFMALIVKHIKGETQGDMISVSSVDDPEKKKSGN